MNATKLTKADIKALEKKYGKHNFCYQCGNPDMVPIEDQHLWPGFCECPKCGSSDLDAG
jgi:transcription elongation factor Elf1